MQTNRLKTIVFTSALIVLSGCGGGSDTNWGIDHQATLPVPKCIDNSDDASISAPLIVASGTEVKKTDENTVLRIWHFENSVEAICTLSGEAVLQQDSEGE